MSWLSFLSGHPFVPDPLLMNVDVCLGVASETVPSYITLKAPIMAAVDDKFGDIFSNFPKKKV